MNKFPCYIHIEKCAGTTLHHTLKYNFPGYIVLRPWYYWSNVKGNYLTAKELANINKIFPWLSGIGGHTSRTYLGYEEVIKKPITYFTFLRDPIARYLSHYNHQVNKMNINWSMEQFLDDERFNNFMTRRIAGVDDLELAKKRLMEDYDFVGLFESFNESLVLMKYFTFDDEIDLYYEHKNDSKDERKIRYSDLPTKIKNKVINNNKLDIELYDFVLSEVYPKQVSDYPYSLPLKLMEFENNNKIYKYNYLRNNVLRGIKLLSDKVIQKMAHAYMKNEKSTKE